VLLPKEEEEAQEEEVEGIEVSLSSSNKISPY
jgi:hypothetical protein